MQRCYGAVALPGDRPLFALTETNEKPLAHKAVQREKNEKMDLRSSSNRSELQRTPLQRSLQPDENACLCLVRPRLLGGGCHRLRWGRSWVSASICCTAAGCCTHVTRASALADVQRGQDDDRTRGRPDPSGSPSLLACMGWLFVTLPTRAALRPMCTHCVGDRVG